MELRDFCWSFASWMGGQHLFVAYPKVGSVHVSKQDILGKPFLEVCSKVIGDKDGTTVQVKLNTLIDLRSGKASVWKTLVGEPRNVLSIEERVMLVETEGGCQVIKTVRRYSKSDDEVEKHLDLVLPKLLQEVKKGEVEEARLIEAMIEALDGIHLEGKEVRYGLGVDEFEWIDLYQLEVGELPVAYVRHSTPMGIFNGIVPAKKVEELVEKIADCVDEKTLEDYLRKWRRFVETSSLSLEAYSKHLNLN